MEELILKSEMVHEERVVSVYWGSLDIDTIRIEEFNSREPIYVISVVDFESKYELKGLFPGRYHVELKLKNKETVYKEIRVL